MLTVGAKERPVTIPDVRSLSLGPAWAELKNHEISGLLSPGPKIHQIGPKAIENHVKLTPKST